MSLIERCPQRIACQLTWDGPVQRLEIWCVLRDDDKPEEGEVEYVRADLHRGAVDLIRELRAAGIDALGPHAEHEEHERWRQVAKRAHTYLGGQ